MASSPVFKLLTRRVRFFCEKWHFEMADSLHEFFTGHGPRLENEPKALQHEFDALLRDYFLAMHVKEGPDG